jgi:glycosyltransferase involved in cell wall biosynthesis
MFETFSSIPLVSISNSQRRPIHKARWIDTVHHGLPVNLLQPQPETPSYLGFLGRISPEKRVDRAIHISERCGLPLKIAAKVDPADQDYFNDQIRHLIDQPHVDFIGEISDSQKSKFLSGAIALIVPIDWPEPFGLVMIEAMACGTPVIAYNRGAAPEIVEDGVTGFVVEDETSAIAAVKNISMLSRNVIRKRFEERFTSTRMAQDYLKAYERVCAQSAAKPKPRLVAG